MSASPSHSTAWRRNSTPKLRPSTAAIFTWPDLTPQSAKHAATILTADESTGSTADENGHIGTMAHSERLWDAMRSLPELASYAVPGDCRCDRAPGRNRIDIEGMATANGRLFFALRAPNVDGSAYIVGVDARALFEGGDLRPSLATIRLGANKGFRDLAIADGVALALVGPSDAESPADYSIVELRGLTTGVAVQPRELAALDLQDAPLGKKGQPHQAGSHRPARGEPKTLSLARALGRRRRRRAAGLQHSPQAIKRSPGRTLFRGFLSSHRMLAPQRQQDDDRYRNPRASTARQTGTFHTSI